MPLTSVFIAFGWMLIHALWQGCFLYVLSRSLVLSRFSARHNYLVLVGLMAVQLLWSGLTFMHYLSQAAAPGYASPTIETQVILSEMSGLLPNANHAVWDWSILISLVWMTGLMYFLIRRFYGYYLLRPATMLPAPSEWQKYLAELTIHWNKPIPLQVFLHAEVTSPCLYGVIKPVILFPVAAFNHLSIREVEFILAHELTHYLHRDHLSDVLVQLISAVYYFHPLLQRMVSEAYLQRECACDEGVVAGTGNSKVDYIKTLIKLSELRTADAHSITFTSQASALARRIQHLLNLKNNSNMKTHLWSMLLAIGFVLSSLFLLNYQAHKQHNSTEISTKNHLEVPFPDPFSAILTDSVPPKPKNYSLTMENGKITKLIVEGKIIPPAEYHKYSALINPPAPPAAPAPPSIADRPNPPSPPTAPPAPTRALPAPPAPPAPAPRALDFDWNWTNELHEKNAALERAAAELEIHLAQTQKHLVEQHQQLQLDMEMQLEQSMKLQEQQMRQQDELMLKQEVEMQRLAEAMAKQEHHLQEQHRRLDQFFKELKNELKKDGLWKDGDDLNIQFNENKVKINGQELPEKWQPKYREWLNKQPRIGVEPVRDKKL